jgi:hypothetical protein
MTGNERRKIVSRQIMKGFTYQVKEFTPFQAQESADQQRV